MFSYRLNKLDEREFKQAIIIIADVWFFKNEELIPYIHPKMLLIIILKIIWIWVLKKTLKDIWRLAKNSQTGLFKKQMIRRRIF